MIRKGLYSCVFVFLLGCFLPTIAHAQVLKEMFMQGIDALENNRYEEAVGHFQKVLKLKADFAPAYNFLGMSYKQLGRDNQEVIGYFEKAIVYDPRYAMAYENLGKAYYSLGNVEKALANCLKAVEYNPDLLTAHLSLGWIYLLGKSQPKKAIRHFRKVVNHSPLPYACLGLGLAYFQDKQLPMVLEMITYLRKAGEENYAKHLEAMIRENRYIPPKVGSIVLDIPRRSQGVLVTDTTANTSNTQTTAATQPTTPTLEDIKNMPVYLRGKLSDAGQEVADPAGQNNTAAERLRALQERGSAISY